ncbi:hypothetical protein [Halococcus hamelinensis]|uniref:Uncharacterized protein n=1 Tax=Halococcus hamelinensis 100A6 TaxID=1132509 RepID=M0M7V0_9EURY|nr:hypothetical protein [Halococcus hamelinensis]EMA40694.1 hypothetical protein C447_04211 [Halococcus hamelinensis 100A6]
MNDFTKGMVVTGVMLLLLVITEYDVAPEPTHLPLYAIGLLLLPVAFYYYRKVDTDQRSAE